MGEAVAMLSVLSFLGAGAAACAGVALGGMMIVCGADARSIAFLAAVGAAAGAFSRERTMRVRGLIGAAIAAGMAAAMGLGGGSFLIIYLTVFAGVSQQAAQGINLVFFIPAAACAVWLHTRNRLVDWKSALPAMIAGAATAIISANIAMKIDGDISRKLFGAFVLIMGMKMLSEKPKSRDI